jgi:hypothetical protein
MHEPSVPQAFAAALDGLIRQVRQDRSVLAAILCGSMAHDTVWARSDIDLVLVTIDDRKGGDNDIPLNADGVNVHALLLPRTEFRKMVEGSVHNSFMHAFLAKGKLIYTHDETIADLCTRLQAMGSRDAAIQVMNAATSVLPPLYKARKWLVTRGDYAYTSLWILAAATPLARMEIIGAGLVADREVLPQAAKLNPALFDTIYINLLRNGTRKDAVETALETLERYMEARARKVFAPLLAYMQEVGDARSSRDIEDHFKKNFGIAGVTTACEYLADLGVLGKASTPTLLTRRSNNSVEELAFYFSGPPDGE